MENMKEAHAWGNCYCYRQKIAKADTAADGLNEHAAPIFLSYMILP